MSKEQETAPASAPITVGSQVVYLGFTGTTTRVGTDQKIDMLFYEDGRARVALNVEHGHALGCWLTPAEHEAGRPRTAKELVSDAIAAGAQAPKIGLRVKYADRQGPTGYLHVVPHRALISDYSDFDTVDLAILRPEPPDDPLEPDEPIRYLKGVKHAGLAEPKIVKQAYAGHWDYEGGIIEEFGPVKMIDLFPSHVCARCKTPCNRHVKVYFEQPEFRQGILMTPWLALCAHCSVELKEFLGVPIPKPHLTVFGAEIASDPDEFVASVLAAS